MRTLTGPSLEARNRVGAAPEVTVTQTGEADAGTIEVPPLSISVLEFPLAETQ